MGRPPNNLGGRRSSEPVKKYFAVPIPPVDPRVYAAVERYVLVRLHVFESMYHVFTLSFVLYYSRIASTRPWLVQRAQLDKTETQLVEFRHAQEEWQEKVEELTTARAQALEEIQTLRIQQLESALQDLEEGMRRDFLKTQQDQVTRLQRECEELLQSMPPAVDDEQEEPPTKKQKVVDSLQDILMKESEEDGEIQESASSSAAQHQEQQEQPKPSELKKKELEEKEHELDGVTETKHQMVWLLKQASARLVCCDV